MSFGALRWLRAMTASVALGVLLVSSADGQPAPNDRAILTVRLPAQATLTVDGTPTKQTGPQRRFVTPPLPAGKSFNYELVATWREGGSTQTVTKTVTVRAGQETNINLAREPVAAIENPKDEEPKPAAKSRTFLFTYSTTVTGLPEGKPARIWLPVAHSDEDQDVTIAAKDLPKGAKVNEDKRTGNRYLYLETTPKADGNIPLSITYKVTRREVKGGTKKDSTPAEQLARFLEADAMVPVDGKPVDEIKEKLKLTDKELPKDQIAAAKVLYEAVNNHMKYGKPKDKAWGRGDSVYAATECIGNCTDFHSLFISLARSEKIPAKFVIGFPLPMKAGAGEIPGYHCWAWFKPKGGGWVPVDISEANKDPKMAGYYFSNLTDNRVAFTTGRDLELVPKQDGKPLNFLIYPYVEVDGKPYGGDKLKNKFSFKDLPSDK
jgi:uncharacterized protein (TIGR03000 family)